MAMSKKHYEMIARRINQAVKLVENTTSADARTVQLLSFNELACDLAFDFRADNPRFDESRFLKACGF